MAIFPMKMKILAIKLAKANLVRCFNYRRNALKAERQKPLPETAMYANADELM